MKLWGMFLTIISWQAYAIYIGVGCVVYCIYVMIRLGTFKKIIRRSELSEHSLLKKTEDASKPEDLNHQPHRSTRYSHQVNKANQFQNFTEEINALLLQAASEKLSREALLEALMSLVSGYNFHETDVELLQAAKEIIIIQASTICHIDYRIEELVI